MSNYVARAKRPQSFERNREMHLVTLKSEPPKEAPGIRPPVDPATLRHRNLLGGDFWRRIPAYQAIDEATFLDHRWQMKNTITKPEKLLAALQGLVAEA